MPERSAISRVFSKLSESYPNIKTSLDFETPFQLLIATILSAQCTDERVNKVTKRLFKRYRTPEDFAVARIADLATAVRPTGYYNIKARRIRNASRMIVERHSSNVPDWMGALLKLEGVGRKTANIVLSVAFGKKEGIAVDTHVRRLSLRLGWTENKDPTKIERDLMKIVPLEIWDRISMLLILHGRTVCTARRPRCADCILNQDCPSAFAFT